jgi:hypothetical protein
MKIKVVIIVILKLDLGSIRGTTRVTNQKGSTRVNVRIKIIIIIVLKSNSGVDRDKAHVTGQRVIMG